jgi:hypothetical protein
MADKAKKVSELNALTSGTLADEDLFIVVDVTASETKKITANNMGVYFTSFVEVGAQGRQGAQGVQGSQGVQGFQGIQGSQGIQGATGSQGTQGAQGTQGVQGSQGYQGPNTPPGPYADDSAAASGGVSVGQFYYQPSGIVYVRLS